MRSSYRKKLDVVINELSSFLGNDFSSRFKYLSPKEDRQLFFLANILAKLKLISKEIEEEKILIFPKKENEPRRAKNPPEEIKSELARV